MKILMAFAIGICAWAQTGVVRPQLGKMLDANGTVRTVYGIAASVILGAAEITEVLSSACSDSFCLAKTGSGIVSASGIVAAPAGPAMFAFSGATAFVWFPQSRQLALWQNGTLTPVDTQIEGDVLSICANAGAVQFAVRSFKGDVWIVNQDGSVTNSLPRATGPVQLIPGGVVYATRNEIVIGNTQFPLDGVTSFSQISGSYLEVHADGVDYALRIDAGRETLFQLPGVSP